MTATSGEAGAYGRAYAAYAPDGEVPVAPAAEVEGVVRTQTRGRGPDGPAGRSRDARAEERGQDERGYEERRLVQEAWS